MTGIFRTNQILINLFLFPIAFIFFINNWEFEAGIVLFVLVMQSIYINHLFQKHRLNTDTHQFSGLFSFLLSVLLFYSNLNWEIILVNSLLLIAISILLNGDRQGIYAGNLLNIGLLLGISIIIIPPMGFMLLVFFYGLNRLRAYKIVERIQVITGIVLVIFYGFLYYFLTNRLDHIQFPNFLELDLGITSYNQIELGVFGLYFFIFLVVVLSFGLYTRKKNILIQKKMAIFYVWVLISIINWILTNPKSIDKLSIISLPLGILIGQNFYVWPKWIGELFFWLILGVGVFLNLKILI